MLEFGMCACLFVYHRESEMCDLIDFLQVKT